MRQTSSVSPACFVFMLVILAVAVRGAVLPVPPGHGSRSG